MCHRLKFLIIGLGSIGKRHFNNLFNMDDVEVIVFRTYKKEHLTKEKLSYIYTNIEEAFAQKPDAVIISNPTHLHMQYALLAAEHKCHIFIEKPLSHALLHAEELIELVKKNNLVTMVGCNLRFHPTLQYVKKLIDDNTIGNIISTRAEVGQYLPSWHPEENYADNYSAKKSTGGGVILDLIHELDYIVWLLGNVTEAFAFTDKLSDLNIDTEDVAEILLKFQNKSIASIHLDYIQKIPVRKCKIIGNNGVVEFDLISGTVELNGIEVFKTYKGLNMDITYIKQMHHFINCIEGKEHSIIPLEKGLETLKLALNLKEGIVCTY